MAEERDITENFFFCFRTLPIRQEIQIFSVQFSLGWHTCQEAIQFHLMTWNMKAPSCPKGFHQYCFLERIQTCNTKYLLIPRKLFPESIFTTLLFGKLTYRILGCVSLCCAVKLWKKKFLYIFLINWRRTEMQISAFDPYKVDFLYFIGTLKAWVCVTQGGYQIFCCLQNDEYWWHIAAGQEP